MKPSTPRGQINASEHAVLTHIARGETVQGAANRLGVTEIAATHRLYRARRRMGATTTTHLVALCIATKQLKAGVAAGSEVER